MPPTTETSAIRSEQDVVLARQSRRRLAQELGFGIVDQTKIVTAASELARNVVVYGQGGEMRWEKLSDGARVGLRLPFRGRGSRHPDLKLAMTDGGPRGRAGSGTVGARGWCNDFEIDTGARPWDARKS
jgi:serine/threonine-protein kinase RsbT